MPVASLGPKQQASIAVEVLGNAGRPFRRRGLSILSVKVGDESGTTRATWFNQPWLAPKLTEGTQMLLTGSADKRGFRVSEYEFSGDASEGLVPIHPGTEQLKAQRLQRDVQGAGPGPAKRGIAQLRLGQLGGASEGAHSVARPGYWAASSHHQLG